MNTEQLGLFNSICLDGVYNVFNVYIYEQFFRIFSISFIKSPLMISLVHNSMMAMVAAVMTEVKVKW